MIKVYQLLFIKGLSKLKNPFKMHLCRQKKVLLLFLLVVSATFVQTAWAAEKSLLDLQDEEDVEANPLPIEEEMNAANAEQAKTSIQEKTQPESTNSNIGIIDSDNFMIKIEPTQKEKNKSDDNLVLREFNQGDGPLVEYRKHIDWNLPFRERRPNHTWMFSFDTASLYMDNFDTIENGTSHTFQEFYADKGEAFPEIFLGYKYNTTIGGFHLDLGYAKFTSTSARSGLLRTLDISRPTARLGFIMDNLFSEPYVAPYINASVWQMTVSESNGTSSVHYTTGVGTSYTAGLLVQLNAIDSGSAFEARKNFGIENTYLDIFVTQQMVTDDSKDPDVSTDPTFGAGFRVEF